MRAPFILAAVLAVGAQAAVVPRSVTTDVTDITTETPTDVSTIAAEATSTEVATSTVEPTETAEAATETSTDSDGEDSDSDEEDDMDFWDSLMTDCSESSAPRSGACVAKLWHSVGCVAEVPEDKLDSWKNAEDMDALKSEMQDYYTKATADDATKEDKDACHPVPKPIMVAVNCVHNVTTDMCKDCFSTSKFLGLDLPNINATCLDSCLRNPDNADAFKEVCPNAANVVNCKDTLNDTCGQCASVKPGSILGLPIMTIDEDCFKDCYQENNSTIREACPLPKPMKTALDCHKTLAKECSECVDDEHDIDDDCLEQCLQDKIFPDPALNETCPPELLAGFQTLAELVPDEDDIEEFINMLFSKMQFPSFDLGAILGGLLGGNAGDNVAPDLSNLENLLQGLLGNMQGGNGTFDLQAFINNILSQLGLGPRPGMSGTSTETAEVTETETSTDDEPESTETSTDMPTATEA